MATANKILGQSKPAGATPTVLYTSTGVQSNVNVFIANQAAAADAFRLAITKSGQVLAAKDYLAYDMPIAANYTLNFTGIALASGDFINVYSTSGNVSFNATGIEIS
jgi:hypothetical protein